MSSWFYPFANEFVARVFGLFDRWCLERRAPVLPVAVIRTERVRSCYHLLRRRTVTAIIGKTLALPWGEGDPDRAQIAAVTELMMERIARLFPPKRQDPYRATKTGIA